MNTADGVDVQSIMFGDRGIEVTYIDPDGFSNDTKILRITTEQVPYELIEDEMGVLMDAVQDVIDATAIARRNPPDTFTRRG